MTALATGRVAEISASVIDRADRYRAEFRAASPFKHVVIDEFFEADFARQLLEQFPRFEPGLARSESGATGGKAVNTNIRDISPAYLRLYESIEARQFLDFVSVLSGVPDLILDPKMFGGGTHENLHGQELDPHVDFNYDEARQLHRRLNLIVYLNPEWCEEWGGALEIHSNPRRPEENQIRSYAPLFNRCVMFETNEYSWHGFPRINLPEGKRHLSRKSISIYLYTKTRPTEEIAPLHATFYVQRPLPDRFVAGHTLSEEDVSELRTLVIRRDRWIELYQNMELQKSREIADASAALSSLRELVQTPLTGYVLQKGPAEGLYGDGWASSRVRIDVKPLKPVSRFLLRGLRPNWAPPAHASIRINGTELTREAIQGEFELSSVPRSSEETMQIEIVSDSPPGWGASKGDDRDLAFLFNELRAEH
jgi:hypothetical protein